MTRSIINAALGVFGLLALLPTEEAAPIVRQPLSEDWCMTRADTFYQDPFNCKKFVRCVGGIKYEFDCPLNTRWDSIALVCNYELSVVCNTTNYIEPIDTKPTPICPYNGPDGNQRDATNCNQYYRCQNGVPYRQYCMPGLYFNPVTSTCTVFNLLTGNDQQFCNGLLISTPTAPTPTTRSVLCSTDGLQRDPSNCGRFFRCVNGVANPDYCQQEQVFNPLYGSCTAFNLLSDDDKAFCSQVTPTTPTSPDCPAGVFNVNITDPSNCGRFYRCNNGQATLQFCPQELYFNLMWRTCTPFNSLPGDEQTRCAAITTQPPSTVCLNNARENQRDPTNCTRYIRCDGGSGYTINCPARRYFNPRSTENNPCGYFSDLSPSDQGFCAALEAEPSTDPDVVCPQSAAVGLQRDPNNCSRYIWCVNRVPYVMLCQEGLYYSTFLQACSVFEDMTPTDQAFCSGLEVTTPTPEVQCPAVPYAVLKDPNDCTVYHVCQFGSRTPLSCLAGTFYSEQAFRCVSPQQLTPERYNECLGNTNDGTGLACRGNNQGRLMDFYDRNCRRYFDCKLGVETSLDKALECPVGRYFNVMSANCTLFNQLPPLFQLYCQETQG